MADLIYKHEALRPFIIDNNGNRIRETDIDNWDVTISIREVKRIIREIPAVDAVVLPCKVGDTVYVIWGKEVVEAVVHCIRPFIFENQTEFRGNAICTIEDPFFDDGRLMKHELFIVFGFDAFITREEAEAVLDERRSENNA